MGCIWEGEIKDEPVRLIYVAVMFSEICMAQAGGSHTLAQFILYFQRSTIWLGQFQVQSTLDTSDMMCSIRRHALPFDYRQRQAGA